jgi:putative DNA primase/helicase
MGQCHRAAPRQLCRSLSLWDRTADLYSDGRYLTLTGCHLADTPATIEPRQAELDAFHNHVFGETPPRGNPTSNGHDPSSPLSDDAILQKALGAKNGRKFAALWAGGIDGYPSHSEADSALCCLLAFYTRDPAQLNRLVRRSELYRDKWERADYREATIARALRQTTEHWHPSQDRQASVVCDEQGLILLPLRPYAPYRDPRKGGWHG